MSHQFPSTQVVVPPSANTEAGVADRSIPGGTSTETPASIEGTDAAKLVKPTAPLNVPTGPAVSAEAVSRFERDAQLLPADQVKVPGSDMTLADVHKLQAEVARKEGPQFAKANNEALVRETSSVLKESKVVVTSEGQVFATPVSKPLDKPSDKSPE